MKIGGFLQCSVDVFLGHDDCFWKIYVRILWNHMKNFQVKPGQCDSIIFPKTFSFESSKELLDLCFPDNMILYFWQVLESIHKFITTELHALQCLFVRGSNKQQRRGRIVSNFTKVHFFVFYDNQVLLGVISQCGPPSYTLQEKLSPLQFGQEENIPGHSIERRAYWFILKIVKVFPIPTGRVGIVSWTLL